MPFNILGNIYGLKEFNKVKNTDSIKFLLEGKTFSLKFRLFYFFLFFSFKFSSKLSRYILVYMKKYYSF